MLTLASSTRSMKGTEGFLYFEQILELGEEVIARR